MCNVVVAHPLVLHYEYYNMPLTFPMLYHKNNCADPLHIQFVLILLVCGRAL